MSLLLAKSTPPDLMTKTYGWKIDKDHAVHIGDYEVPLDDFCCLVEYVMTNTDLSADDPRILLLERLKKLTITDGWGLKEKRLGYPIKKKNSTRSNNVQHQNQKRRIHGRK